MVSLVEGHDPEHAILKEETTRRADGWRHLMTCLCGKVIEGELSPKQSSAWAQGRRSWREHGASSQSRS